MQNLSNLVDEIIVAKKEFADNMRWDLINFYHVIGEILSRRDNLDYAHLSEKTGISQRNLYRSRQFFVKYSDINLLPEGKNTSWHAVCNKYLPIPRELETLEEIQLTECDHVFKCVKCGVRNE